MKTKFLVRFLSRAAHFDADLELVDIFASAIKNGALQPKSGDYLLAYLQPLKHRRLAERQSSDMNRKIAITHLKRTLCAAFIKDLYEEVTAYFTDLVAGAARAGLSPDRILGEHKVTFDANDVLKCGTWEGVIRLVSTSLFRKLEDERSTLKLLVAIDKKLDLSVDTTLRDAALPYLELRHLLIHADGVVDKSFCDRYPLFDSKPGKQIDLNNTIASEARKSIVAMVRNYDEAAVKKGIFLNTDLQK